jgi:hypothetical protein
LAGDRKNSTTAEEWLKISFILFREIRNILLNYRFLPPAHFKNGRGNISLGIWAIIYLLFNYN